jgi:hypothetical protein
MHRIRRFFGVLAALAGALAAFGAAVPAALAVTVPPGPDRPGVLPASSVHAVVVGGMPGWQIALIAVGAALAGAAIAILLDRARAARKTHLTTA